YSRFKENIPSDNAEIHVEATVLNSRTNPATAAVDFEIVSPEGKSLTHFKGSQTIAGGLHETLKAESTVASPVLWSPESPKLYRLITTVAVDNAVVDRKETTFGIRTVAFDKDKGFLLNGKHYWIYGTCNHQDHAGVGVAIPDALQEFRVKRLKEIGCNAIRTSHNPPAPELLDICDRLGMLVMDESRLLGADSENLRKWDGLIRRDRNHPSVAIWSVANEEFNVQDSPQGANAALAMQNYVKRLDPTRPVTYPAPEGDVFVGINSVIEVRGWNYRIGKGMDDYHSKHPEQPNVGSEQGSTVTTRGVYESDARRGYVSAYGNKTSWSNLPEEWWGFFAERPWLSGGFIWTGFDYRGEPTPYWWPCINSHFGILDMCGFPKDVAYYYKSWWTTNTVLHLLPHWNWSASAASSGVASAGKEGQEIRVDALSNCKAVELFLNGNSLGRQAMRPNSSLTWQVKYAPGTLSAKGFDASGNVIAETKVETTGEAARLQLIPDRPTIQADGEDVAVFTVSALDAQGRAVPVAQDKINFAIEGAGRIIGVGNGDPSCHEPDVFMSVVPARTVPVNNWRWQLAEVPGGSGVIPEYAPELDDSSWKAIKPKTDGDTGELVIRKQGATAVFRAHFNLTEEDLKQSSVRIKFSGCDDEGWYFVNNQFVGESHDWQAQPAFDIKKFVHAGDNVVSVGLKNLAGDGGLNPNVNVDIVGEPKPAAWSRSLFNGLAQIIVQSTKDAGEIKLTATAAGLAPATFTLQAQPCTPRPFVP
ncbi:MAG TPA: glycoside hydrolase family 2 TIM barrel-domain containing protein, partial [Candidatus Paceibacterota bacterium]|nr:glycoside hydrolase family 2 TIM barrel-domain containing protein [Candidatus Paceibacterota bacterium]